MLRPNEYLEITFKIKNPGKIVIKTCVRLEPTLPFISAYQKIELFKPGKAKPIVSKTEKVSGYLTLKYNVSIAETNSDGNWVARVTSFEKEIEPFMMHLYFPGNFLLNKFVVPTSVIKKFIDSTIGLTKIRMTSGKNDSYILFPKNFGISNIFFTVPDFKHTINMRWPIPDIHLQEHTNNINSGKISFLLENASSEFPRGYIRFVVYFEEMGAEILGTFHCHLSDMRLTIDLGLEMQNHKISYNRNNVQLNFSYNFDILGIEDRIRNHIFDPISNYAQHIKKIVENIVYNIFRREEMHQAFSNSITELITRHLRDNPKILVANIKNNQLEIQYFKL